MRSAAWPRGHAYLAQKRIDQAHRPPWTVQ